MHSFAVLDITSCIISLNSITPFEFTGLANDIVKTFLGTVQYRAFLRHLSMVRVVNKGKHSQF